MIIGVLILGIIGGAYLKDKEIKERAPIAIVKTKTLIEQSIAACEANVKSYTNRGLGFECVVWRK